MSRVQVGAFPGAQATLQAFAAGKASARKDANEHVRIEIHSPCGTVPHQDQRIRTRNCCKGRSAVISFGGNFDREPWVPRAPDLDSHTASLGGAILNWLSVYSGLGHIPQVYEVHVTLQIASKLCECIKSCSA